MIRTIHRFLSKIMVILVMACVALPAMGAASNLPAPDIGDFGTWATENNRQRFVSQLSNDVEQFQRDFQKQIVDDYVPIEAKVGIAFMNAFSFISHVLDSSLVRFVIIFIILAYVFWTSFEAYTLITGKSQVQPKVIEILKRGALVLIWVGILSIGPAETFMMVMSPILQVATMMSNAILDAVSNVVGVSLPDTCTAIQQYSAQHISQTNILKPEVAADIMCLPTRLSGFCYTAVAVGWKWMRLGIGASMFSFLCGLSFVAGFVYLAWRFAFVAFGVIADLFLGIIMLPFTAVAETIGKTSYKGIAGDIFNTFMGLFKAESLQAQIMRFVNAALHFVVLAIVIAVCTGLLSGIIDIDAAQGLPHFDDPGMWIAILIAALTWYLASNASKFATEFGGAINTAMGDALQGDAKTLINKTKTTATKWWKIIKEGAAK